MAETDIHDSTALAPLEESSDELLISDSDNPIESPAPSPSQKINWGGIYKWFFCLVILPGAVATLWFIITAKPQQATINTPYSQAEKLDKLQMATKVILKEALADDYAKLAAADTVIQQQSENLVRQKVQELSTALGLGRRNPSHEFYGKSLNECLDIIEVGINRDRQTAMQLGDTDALLKIDRLLEVTNRIRQGRVLPGEFNVNIYTVALKTRHEALRSQMSNSVEGKAQRLLDEQPETKGTP